MVSTLLRDPQALSSILASLGMLQPWTFGSLKMHRDLGLSLYIYYVSYLVYSFTPFEVQFNCIVLPPTPTKLLDNNIIVATSSARATRWINCKGIISCMPCTILTKHSLKILFRPRLLLCYMASSNAWVGNALMLLE